MQEIIDHIDRLTACYVRQMESYAALNATAADERRLVRDSEMDALTPILRRKQTLLAAVEEEQPAIMEQQKLLAAFFDLPEFSVPQMLERAPNRYQPALQRLQEALQRLIAVLEQVEDHEKELEAELRQRAGESPIRGPQSKERAAKAYKKHKPKA